MQLSQRDLQQVRILGTLGLEKCAENLASAILRHAGSTEASAARKVTRKAYGGQQFDPSDPSDGSVAGSINRGVDTAATPASGADMAATATKLGIKIPGVTNALGAAGEALGSTAKYTGALTGPILGGVNALRGISDSAHLFNNPAYHQAVDAEGRDGGYHWSKALDPGSWAQGAVASRGMYDGYHDLQEDAANQTRWNGKMQQEAQDRNNQRAQALNPTKYNSLQGPDRDAYVAQTTQRHTELAHAQSVYNKGIQDQQKAYAYTHPAPAPPMSPETEQAYSMIPGIQNAQTDQARQPYHQSQPMGGQPNPQPTAGEPGMKPFAVNQNTPSTQPMAGQPNPPPIGGAPNPAPTAGEPAKQLQAPTTGQTNNMPNVATNAPQQAPRAPEVPSAQKIAAELQLTFLGLVSRAKTVKS